MKGWGSYSTNSLIKVAHASLGIQQREGDKKNNQPTTKTPPPATKLLDILFNDFLIEQQILSTN